MTLAMSFLTLLAKPYIPAIRKEFTPAKPALALNVVFFGGGFLLVFF